MGLFTLLRSNSQEFSSVTSSLLLTPLQKFFTNMLGGWGGAQVKHAVLSIQRPSSGKYAVRMLRVVTLTKEVLIAEA